MVVAVGPLVLGVLGVDFVGVEVNVKGDNDGGVTVGSCRARKEWEV